jgi:hypothetical protein
VWQTTFSESLSGNSGGWGGYNLRVVIPASALSISGSTVRVTLQSGTGGGFQIDHAAIGHSAASGDPYDENGGQVALTFNSGSAGCTIGTNTEILSDEVAFSLDETKNLVIAIHFVSGDLRVGATGAYYKSAASEVLVSDVSGYTGTGFSYAVSKIETK